MDDDDLSDILNEEIPEWDDDGKEENTLKSNSNDFDDIDSILNESEDMEADIEADLNSPSLNSSLTQNDLLSISSSDTTSITSRKAVAKRKQKSLQILKHGILKGASSQLNSAKSKVDSGQASCLTIGKYLAVGTTRGFVFIFDMKQILKFCLGSVRYGHEFGAVSSLSFNRDSSRLIAGFAKGQIVMWDVTGPEGKTLRTITDAHAPGTAVLFIRFSDDPTLAVCADSSGSVFQLAFKRGIGGRTCDSVCLFTGSRGETCCIEPLNLPLSLKIDRYPISSFSLLAMASFTSVHVVGLKPSVHLFYKHQLKGSASTLPQLAWRLITIERNSLSHRIEPVLAFGRDDAVYLLKVSLRTETNLNFELIQTIRLNFRLLSLKWVNQYTLALIDNEEILHIIDAPTESELERIDIAQINMCYNSSLFKSLATGGNVSEALAYAGDFACYHSVVSFEGQLLVLGQPLIHMYMLRNWEERLSMLMSSGNHETALTLCSEFYLGKTRGVMGLPVSESARKATVMKRAESLLEEFVNQLMGSPFPDSEYATQLSAIFSEAANAAIKLCCILERTDLLVSLVYEKMSVHPVARLAFLDRLYPEVIEGNLRSVPPIVIKDLVEHFNRQGKIGDIEKCITKLDIASLDLDQVTRICWTNNLHSAIIHIYTTAFMDYETPLQKLTEKLLESFKSQGKFVESDMELGHKIFVYIRSCLAGESYLGDEIPAEVVKNVQQQIFDYILSKNSDDRTSTFPKLYTYLQLNTVDFLNMVTLALEDSFFTETDEGLCRKQRLIDAIILVMKDWHAFSVSQVASFFIFLSRQLVRPENAKLKFDTSLFDQVLEFLCSDQSEEEVKSMEYQQAIIDLLQSGRISPGHKQEWLLNMAKRAGFYQVCEYLYQQRREFAPIIECYVRDPYRQPHIFLFVEGVMSDKNIPENEKSKVVEECLNFIKEMVAISPDRTIHLFLDCLEIKVDNVVEKLNKDRNNETLFKLLEAFFLVRLNISESDEQNFSATQEIHPMIGERYLELLCSYKSSEVYHFLKSSSDYRPAAALSIVRQYNMPREIACLYEQLGDINKASSIYIKLFDSAWQELSSSVTVHEASDRVASDHLIENVESCAYDVINLCKNNAADYKESQESLWFPILDSMLKKQRNLQDQSLLSLIKSLFQFLLNAMSPFISLPTILTKMLQDPAYKGEKFGEIQNLILGMLETFQYESTLLETCRRSLYHDLQRHRLTYLELAMRGHGPRRYKCQICNRPFRGSFTDQLIIFRCRHGFHASCLNDANSFFTSAGEVIWICLICTNSELQKQNSHPELLHRQSSSTRHQVEEALTSRKETFSGQEASETSRRRFDQLQNDFKSSCRVSLIKELSKRRQHNPTRNPFDSTTMEGTSSRFSDLLGEFKTLNLSPAHP